MDCWAPTNPPKKRQTCQTIQQFLDFDVHTCDSAFFFWKNNTRKGADLFQRWDLFLQNKSLDLLLKMLGKHDKHISPNGGKKMVMNPMVESINNQNTSTSYSFSAGRI